MRTPLPIPAIFAHFFRGGALNRFTFCIIPNFFHLARVFCKESANEHEWTQSITDGLALLFSVLFRVDWRSFADSFAVLEVGTSKGAT